MGERAERFVEERLRAALPETARLYANVNFTAKTREHGPAHDGEADIVIVHPDYGLLVIEVKSGAPSVSHGTWYLGDRKLDRSPFKQAEDAKHDLKRTIEALPDWPSGRELRAGHAVAFPDADLASLPKGHTLLGPDAKLDLGLRRRRVRDDGGHPSRPRAGPRLVGCRRQPRLPADPRRVRDRQRLPRADRRAAPAAPARPRGRPRAAARRLARPAGRAQPEPVEGAGRGRRAGGQRQEPDRGRDGVPARSRGLSDALRVLQPAAGDRGAAGGRGTGRAAGSTARRDDLPPAVRGARPACRRAVAATAKADPAGLVGRDAADGVKQAIDANDESRYHAIVVDEGQDFRLDWLETLPWLLFEPDGRRVLGVPRSRAGASPRRRGRGAASRRPARAVRGLPVAGGRQRARGPVLPRFD